MERGSGGNAAHRMESSTMNRNERDSLTWLARVKQRTLMLSVCGRPTV
jgi:hypothetical protein